MLAGGPASLAATVRGLVVLGALLAGCAAPEKGPTAVAFSLVSIEEGGKCPTPDPCWRRIVVTSERELRRETPGGSVVERIQPEELTRVRAIVGSEKFRETIGSATPLCPPAFGLQIIFVLETQEGRLRDPYGQGCVSDEYKDHPYHALRALFQELSSRYFPGA